MISPVDEFVPKFAEAGADIITVHPEAGPHVERTIELIRKQGKKAGISLNPGTPAAAVDSVISEVDLILVMSVHPGFGGQTFLASQLDKIRDLRSRIDAGNRPIDLEVDGGITSDTAAQAIAAGADLLVAGTATFAGGPGRYAANISRLRGAA